MRNVDTSIKVNSYLKIYGFSMCKIILVRNKLLPTALWFVLTLRRLMSYIYGAPILDVSRSHTTTQHSR